MFHTEGDSPVKPANDGLVKPANDGLIMRTDDEVFLAGFLEDLLESEIDHRVDVENVLFVFHNCISAGVCCRRSWGKDENRFRELQGFVKIVRRKL